MSTRVIRAREHSKRRKNWNSSRKKMRRRRQMNVNRRETTNRNDQKKANQCWTVRIFHPSESNEIGTQCDSSGAFNACGCGCVCVLRQNTKFRSTRIATKNNLNETIKCVANLILLLHFVVDQLHCRLRLCGYCIWWPHCAMTDRNIFWHAIAFRRFDGNVFTDRDGIIQLINKANGGRKRTLRNCRLNSVVEIREFSGVVDCTEPETNFDFDL